MRGQGHAWRECTATGAKPRTSAKLNGTDPAVRDSPEINPAPSRPFSRNPRLYWQVPAKLLRCNVAEGLRFVFGVCVEGEGWQRGLPRLMSVATSRGGLLVR